MHFGIINILGRELAFCFTQYFLGIFHVCTLDIIHSFKVLLPPSVD